MDNIFYSLDSGKNNITTKVKSGLQKYLIFIVLLFNIALEIVSRLYTFGIHSPFTVEFFLNLSVSLAITMVCYVCFIPFGRAEERKRNLDYDNAVNLWGELSEKVRTGFMKLFSLFCQTQVQEEREEAKKLLLENNTMISYDEFKTKYAGKSPKHIRGVKELSFMEKRIINKVNGFGLFSPVKIKPINPVTVLCGRGKKSINDAGRSDRSYTFRYLTTKPIIMFLTSAIFNSISTTFIGGGKGVILDMLLSVFQIIVAAVCGYSVGVTDFKHSLGKINNRILFISLFFENNK